MYDIKVTLTDKQFNLLSEALFYYSEEKDNVTKDIEELEDLIDLNTKKVKRNRKFVNPECDI
jgi:transcription elongation factor GreA-like protein|tara:strand:- start:19 stop:204 length:186 start_codon:yes stop_codon:yes gene_type:complete